MKLHKVDLEKLKERLPYGWQKKIAEHCELSTETVKKVLQGDFYNREVIEAAIELAKENIENENRIKREIDKLDE
jgi:hypothetical protein